VRTQRICEYIASNLERKIRLETLAEMGALSVRHFSRPFQTKSSCRSTARSFSATSGVLSTLFEITNVLWPHSVTRRYLNNHGKVFLRVMRLISRVATSATSTIILFMPDGYTT
jgi:AraC-like DNA-binding protein